jgi:hypothetical protein
VGVVPPTLSAFSVLRTEAEGVDKLMLLAERSERSEAAWSGVSVVVVGGRVRIVDASGSMTVMVTVETADPGEDGDPLFPQSVLFPPLPPWVVPPGELVLTVGKGTTLLPRDEQLLLAMPPWLPEAVMMEAALF